MMHRNSGPQNEALGCLWRGLSCPRLAALAALAASSAVLSGPCCALQACLLTSAAAARPSRSPRRAPSAQRVLPMAARSARQTPSLPAQSNKQERVLAHDRRASREKALESWAWWFRSREGTPHGSQLAAAAHGSRAQVVASKKLIVELQHTTRCLLSCSCRLSKRENWQHWPSLLRLQHVWAARLPPPKGCFQAASNQVSCT